MKKQSILLSLIVVAGAAMAGEPASFDPVNTPSNTTRSQVEAELAAAIKAGALPQTGEVGAYGVDMRSAPARDAAAVRAEGRQASTGYRTVGEV